ncbi:MAG: DNA-deoxyinosine glycosylase [Clostridiales bacterium]|nr:DNA-deoxyinosine glycosylase [Clostridiales bacterium]
MYRGFEPFFDENSRVLILGSFPSVKSRESGFYYGNKQNRFFKTLSRFFGDTVGENIEEKKAFLRRYRIALYDVIEECEITGSADDKITAYRPADIDAVLKNAPIEKILLNGTKAYSVFREFYPEKECVLMPSTSPANVRYDYDKWARELEFLIEQKIYLR